MLLAFGLVTVLTIGATRDSGPQTPADRVNDISRRLACPICDGESVFESRNNASEAIRAEIRFQVGQGQLSDEEIIQSIADTYDGEMLLVPRATGIEALAWSIPAVALVCAVAGLTIAFRRWRADAAAVRPATADDYALVDAAIAAQAAGDHPDRAEPDTTDEAGDGIDRPTDSDASDSEQTEV